MLLNAGVRSRGRGDRLTRAAGDLIVVLRGRGGWAELFPGTTFPARVSSGDGYALAAAQGQDEPTEEWG